MYTFTENSLPCSQLVGFSNYLADTAKSAVDVKYLNQSL